MPAIQRGTPADSAVGNELYIKLRSLIIARLIIASTLLLGAALPLEIAQSYNQARFLFRFVTLVLILSVIYSGLLNRFKYRIIFAYIQLIGDIALETIILVATGGIDSPFSILYVLTIIVGSYLIPGHGAITTAFIVSLHFGTIIICQYMGWTGWWPLKSEWILFPPPPYAYYSIIVNLAGFFLTAILANHLTERIRKINMILTNRNVQYDNLLALNERIISEIPSGLITATLDGYIVSINPAAERMLKESDTRTGVNHLDDVIPKYLAESILKIISNPDRQNPKIQFQKSLGEDKRWYQIRISPLGGVPQNPARIILICDDITDQKRFEDERRKAERWSAIAEISAGMAHEIRNPLASISGSIEVLRETLQTSQSESRLMNIIIKESERLNNLISDFLDLAKPRPPEFTMENIHAIIDETLLLITQSTTWSNEIKVQKTYEPDAFSIEIDKDQFTQLLWNVVKNALEAMPEGGYLSIKTSLDTMPVELQTGSQTEVKQTIPCARITVSDTGIGMTPEILEKIFEPFTTYKRKGVGIGLAIVYRIVENHRGSVEVASSPGKGTTFAFRLPLRQNDFERNRREDEVTG
ncbi:PAS domain-containing protein [bacterium]|nr:PAS domain-containing protein [candidate division CSSED10-310 bacterium]